VTSAAFVAYTMSAIPSYRRSRNGLKRNPLDNDCQRVFSFLVLSFFISAIPPIMEVLSRHLDNPLYRFTRVIECSAVSASRLDYRFIRRLGVAP